MSDHQRKNSAKPTAADKRQSAAFIEKSREIGADEESSCADELLGRLAKIPPKPKRPSAKAKNEV
jgi:hypothetical protein